MLSLFPAPVTLSVGVLPAKASKVDDDILELVSPFGLGHFAVDGVGIEDRTHL